MIEEFRSKGINEAKGLGVDILKGTGGGPISALRTGSSSLWNYTKSSTGSVLRMLSILTRPIPMDPLPEDAPKDPAERFQYAVDAYGRDGAYVNLLQDNKYRLFLLFVAFAAGILAIDIATWTSYSSNIFFVVGHIAPIVPMVTNAVVCAFHNWQVRNRRLAGFMDFIRNPMGWWPEPSETSTINGTARSVAGLVLLASGATAASIIGVSHVAHAQAASSSVSITPSAIFSSLPSTDLWNNLLSFAFPGVGPITGSPAPLNDAITSAFSALIACLMAVGAGFLSYDTITSTVDVAHDGSLLNRKWHTTWSPIRVAYGMASLAPVVKGYCLLQIAVIWAAVISGNMGNALWSAFLGNIGASSISQPSLPQTIGTVNDIMTMEICEAYLEADRTRKMQANPGANIPMPTRDSAHQVIGQNGMMDAASVESLSGMAVSINPSSNTIQWNYGSCGTVYGSWDINASGNGGTLANAQVAAVDSLRNALRPVAVAFVASQMPGPGSGGNLSQTWQSIVSAKASYDNALTTAAQAYVDSSSTNTGMRGAGQNSLSQFQSVLSSQGWASAGAAYMTLARINAKQVAAIQAMPSVTTNGDMSQNLATVLGQGGSQILSEYSDWWKQNVVNPANGLSQKDINAAIQAMRAADMHQNSSSLYQGMQYLLSSDSGIQQFIMGITQIQPGQMDGLQEMVNLGDNIVGVSEGIMALYIGSSLTLHMAAPEVGVLSQVKNMASRAASASGPILSFGTMFFGILATSIFASGVYDSLILPMLPFTHFMFATMGIFLTVIEGVIAAPIWALMHVRMAGAEFIQNEQRAGYQIFFNLLFRIPLTLFGLFFSILVFNAMIWLMSVTFYPALASATAESLFGFISVVVMVVFITILNYQIASRSFLLINQIPDRVTRWFGASDHTDESHHVSTIIGGVVGGARQSIEAGAGASKGALNMARQVSGAAQSKDGAMKEAKAESTATNSDR